MPRTIATISAIEQFIDETQTIQRTTVTAQFSPSLDDDPLHHPLFDDDDATAKSKCPSSIWAAKRAWLQNQFHWLQLHKNESELLSIPLGLSRDKIWREKLFLGLVQIEINLLTLLSICTKPTKSFSRPIFSRDKPSGIDNTTNRWPISGPRLLGPLIRSGS